MKRETLLKHWRIEERCVVHITDTHNTSDLLNAADNFRLKSTTTIHTDRRSTDAEHSFNTTKLQIGIVDVESGKSKVEFAGIIHRSNPIPCILHHLISAQPDTIANTIFAPSHLCVRFICD